MLLGLALEEVERVEIGNRCYGPREAVRESWLGSGLSNCEASRIVRRTESCCFAIVQAGLTGRLDHRESGGVKGQHLIGCSREPTSDDSQ